MNRSIRDYTVRYGVMRTVPAGYHLHHGRRIADTKTVPGYMTRLGSMDVEQWHDELLPLIEAEGQKPLLEEIKVYCRSACPWLKTQREAELYAMECLASGAYQAWGDFHPRTERR